MPRPAPRTVLHAWLTAIRRVRAACLDPFRTRPGLGQLFNFISDRGSGEQLAYVDRIDVLKKIAVRPTKDSALPWPSSRADATLDD